MEGSHHVNCNSIMFRKRTVKKTEIDRLFLAAKSFNTNLVHFLPGGGRSSIKYVRPDFVSLDPLPPVCALTLLPSPFPLLLFPPSPLVRAYWYYILKKIWQISFVNSYQSKNSKQRYKIKKPLYKAIGKCWIKTSRRALRSSLLLSIRGRWKRIILAVWMAHFLAKKNHGIYTLSVEPPPSPNTSQYTLSQATPPSSLLRAYVHCGWLSAVLCYY